MAIYKMHPPEGGVGLGNTNCIVERDTKRLVDVVAALVLEHVVLKVLKDREEDTARFVGRDTAVGTVDAPLENGS